jgi:TRAP transporter TAXI family solute receptor
MKRLYAVIGALAILTLLFATPKIYGEETLRLATGERGKYQWIMGKRISELLSRSHTTTGLVVTKGGNESIDMLLSDEVDLAIVSGPELSRYLTEHSGTQHLVTTAPIWPSAVHFLIRSDFIETDTLQDFDRRRIYTGPDGSWEKETAQAILAAAGIRTKRLIKKVSEYELFGVLTDFVAQELDGVVIVNPIPDPTTDTILSETGHNYKLIPMGQQELKIVQNTVGELFLITLPPGTYSYQVDELTTLAVPNFIITTDDFPRDTVNTIVSMIYENAHTIREYHPWDELQIDDGLKSHLLVPLHEGARDFFSEE